MNPIQIVNNTQVISFLYKNGQSLTFTNQRPFLPNTFVLVPLQNAENIPINQVQVEENDVSFSSEISGKANLDYPSEISENEYR